MRLVNKSNTKIYKKIVASPSTTRKGETQKRMSLRTPIVDRLLIESTRSIFLFQPESTD